MLETGRRCISCGEKKYLKDIDNKSGVCFSCLKESRESEFQKQIELHNRHHNEDPTVSVCDCGNFYINLRKKKNGKYVKFKECPKCRSEKRGIETRTASTGMKGRGGRLSRLSDEGKRERKEEGSVIKKTSPIEKSIESKSESIIKRQESVKSSASESGEKETERSVMSTKEESTKSLITSSASLKEGESLTPQLDSKKVLSGLKEESYNSIKSLNDSSEQLIGYAKRIAKPLKVAEDDGEILQDTTVERMMNAAKCLDIARNTMKAKLDYLKFGKSIADTINRK